VRVVSLICGSVLVVYGAIAGVGLGALKAAQPKIKPPPIAKVPKPQAGPKPAAKQANKQAAKAVPADQLEKLLKMSPEEREKNLSKYPPAQRQNLENRLNNLDKLSPEDRAQRLDRARRLESLPPARRQAVTQEVQSIRQLPTVKERRAAINSPEFQKNYSPEEQQLIREQFPGAAK
jgi:uncharacterized protein DUF3106